MKRALVVSRQDGEGDDVLHFDMHRERRVSLHLEDVLAAFEGLCVSEKPGAPASTSESFNAVGAPMYWRHQCI